MPVTQFPDPRDAPPDGLLAIGGDLHPDSLLLAYSQGIFPWPVTPEDDEEAVLAWFSPDPRAILKFDELHIPKSLKRAQNRSMFRFTLNRAFEDVIRACARSPRPGQNGTWITPEMIQAYVDFHHLGHAHSVEVWEGNDLVGGIYGVEVGGAFAGESMFHERPNASKLALLHLVELLQKEGVPFMDIQMMTPHLQALGAREITRDDYLKELSRVHALGLRPFRKASST